MDNFTPHLAARFKLEIDEAQALVEAGLETPVKIGAASDEEIEEAAGKAVLDKVRAAFPKR